MIKILRPYSPGHGPAFTLRADASAPTWEHGHQRTNYRVRIYRSRHGGKPSARIFDEIIGVGMFSDLSEEEEQLNALRAAISFFSFPSEDSSDRERELARDFGDTLRCEFDSRFGAES